MSAVSDKKLYSVEEYFELEERSDVRHEYYRGELFPIAGTTKQHNKIRFKCSILLDAQLGNSPCVFYDETIKVEVISREYYPYPDLVITCDPRDNESDVLVKYPSVIIEISSEGTMTHDRTFKLQRYLRIPSLQHYVMISQQYCWVECYTRQENSWLYVSHDNLEETLTLTSPALQLPLKDIYEGIALKPMPIPEDSADD